MKRIYPIPDGWYFQHQGIPLEWPIACLQEDEDGWLALSIDHGQLAWFSIGTTDRVSHHSAV
jgi:hypothetical protein